MIARRIIICLLFVLFFVIFELNKNTVWGWVLLLAATAGLFAVFETGLPKGVLPRIACWAVYFGLVAGIFFLTYPPVRRVPAALSGGLSETGVIELRDGKVSGVLDGEAGVELYAGIPYAAPPVGELRWKEPQDVQPWEGVLKADTFAPMSMQPRKVPIYYSLERMIGFHDYKWFDLSQKYRPEVSEDSLYVNVWKPAGEISGLPVLVFVHGGSLQTGQPFYKDYSGEGLASKGVVVVNMGYRLGVFGFLALPELAAESPNGTTGNYGLLDQIKALEWVRDNISAFGGDPDNVTLAGESAGAAAVSALCTSPLAKGLFKRVILESSTLAPEYPPHSYRTYEEALESGERFKQKYGAATLEELRALPAEKIVSAADTEHHITVDGYALTKSPAGSYAAGEFNETAALHGFNAKESGPFIILSGAKLKNYEQKIRSYFGEYTEEVLALYPAKTDREAAEYWAEIYGAVFFDYPHHVYNRLAVKNGIDTYEYCFAKDNGAIGSWHSGEMIYAYGNIPADSCVYNESDRELMRVFSSYFLNFVKNGDPNGEGLPRFDRNRDSLSYLELGEKVVPVKEKDRKAGLFEILDKIQNKRE